jgi:hypothetical protein
MSATIYAVPQEFEDSVPNIFETRDGSYQEKENEWREKLRQYCLEIGADDGYTGETIKFGVADGYAEYMVAQLTPKVELLHLPLMDGYHYPDVKYYPASAIKKKIDADKRWAEFQKTQCTVGEVNDFLEQWAEETYDMPEADLELKMDDHIIVEWNNPFMGQGKCQFFVKEDNMMYGEQEEKVINYLKRSFVV